MSDVAATLKMRLMVMLTVVVVAFLAAAALLVGYLKFGLSWALPGFVAALAVGFAAQIWFIAGLRGRSGKGA